MLSIYHFLSQWKREENRRKRWSSWTRGEVPFSDSGKSETGGRSSASGEGGGGASSAEVEGCVSEGMSAKEKEAIEEMERADLDRRWAVFVKVFGGGQKQRMVVMDDVRIREKERKKQKKGREGGGQFALTLYNTHYNHTTRFLSPAKSTTFCWQKVKETCSLHPSSFQFTVKNYPPSPLLCPPPAARLGTVKATLSTCYFSIIQLSPSCPMLAFLFQQAKPPPRSYLPLHSHNLHTICRAMFLRWHPDKFIQVR